MWMNSRRVVALVLVTAALILGPSLLPSYAKTVRDPDDAAGKLDIRVATTGTGSNQVIFTLSTYGSWRSRILNREEGTGIDFLIDARGDSKAELIAVVYFRNGRLRVNLAERYTADSIASVPATRPNNRTLRFKIDKQDFNADGDSIRWFAVSAYTDTGDCSNVCRDRAPDNGKATQPL